MNMIEAQQAIVKNIYSPTLLAEPITYNGLEIMAVPEIGATLSRSDWNDAATTVEKAAIGDLAVFSVQLCDVPNPQEGDVIYYKDEKYLVAQILLIDTVGGVVVVNCMVNGKGFGMRKGTTR